MFAAATALAGRLDPIALTSHQIALNVASVTYMVPLGVASAGAVRVGQAIGRRDAHAVEPGGVDGDRDRCRVHGLRGTRIARRSPRRSSASSRATRLSWRSASRCCSWRRCSSCSTACRASTTGVLRGLGDTRTAMIVEPRRRTGCSGCLSDTSSASSLGWGVLGLWIGLSLGLVAVGLVLLATWAARIRAIRLPAWWSPFHDQRRRRPPLHAALLRDVRLQLHRVPLGVAAAADGAVPHPRPWRQHRRRRGCSWGC